MDIETVTAYMAEHLADEISMEKVAKHFHYAPAYFPANSRKRLGLPFVSIWNPCVFNLV